MKKKEMREYHLKFILFLLCLLLVILCIIGFNRSTYRLPIFEGTDFYQEHGWTFGEKDGAQYPTQLSDIHLIEPGKTYVLSTHLSYTGEGDDYPSALMTVGNYQVKVFLDGEKVFQYTREERGFPMVKSMGGAAFSVPLGSNCQGRELKLELTTSMDYPLARRMPGVHFGNFAAHIERLYFENLPSGLITMAILFVAIALVVLGNTTPKKRWAYLFFSLFALIIVVYRGSQDLFFMYMWANPLASVTLEFFSLVACPLPVVLSYRHELKPYYSKAFSLLIAGSILNIVGQLALHFLGIRDVVENLIITHLWILICAVSLVYMSIQAEKKDSSIHCMRKLIPILVGGCIDFLIFYVKMHAIGPGSFFVIGDFIGLGVLGSLLQMILEVRKERENAFTEYERNVLLEKIAYVDVLTGIQNRAAFTREIDAIRDGRRQEQSVLAVEADLNDLKKVNDNLGHGAGDDLIKRAASLLNDCFASYGNVYRTGGDEFYAILYGVTEAQWESIFHEFRETLASRNENCHLPLSIAVGHAFMDDSIDACIQKADKEMYKDKVRCKHGASYGFSHT